jgi:hypothetical protein
VATRKASGEVLAALYPVLPELWGGSADLAESNNTAVKGAASFLPAGRQTKMWSGGPYGRTLHFGVREHAMGAIMNGIALHGGTRVYGGTFLTFSDYMRGAVRLAALMQLPVTYVWTHDSIGLGEDGPTHQPIEHYAALRAIPGLDFVRPADANETAVAWRTILEHNDRPSGLPLSRQNLPVFDRTEFASAEGVARGGYVLAEASGGWREFVGDAGRIVGLDHFGASAAYTVLYEQFGLTADAVVVAARDSLAAAEAPPAAPTLAAFDALPEGSPERGELLRRERLYHSHIEHWRGQQEKGTLPGTAGKPRRDTESEELARLRAENKKLKSDAARLEARSEKLAAQLDKTKTALDIAGKHATRMPGAGAPPGRRRPDSGQLR